MISLIKNILKRTIKSNSREKAKMMKNEIDNYAEKINKANVKVREKAERELSS